MNTEYKTTTLTTIKVITELTENIHHIVTYINNSCFKRTLYYNSDDSNTLAALYCEDLSILKLLTLLMILTGIIYL